MKRLILFVCSMLLVSSVWSATQYRDFKNTEGKVIRGCIKGYDAKTKTVSIERDNKRVSTAPISMFSEADQAYILSWSASEGFTSDRLLKISGEKKRTDQEKVKNYGDVTYSDGSVENELISETFNETYVYELELYSLNASALENIRLDYIIYYEQSETKHREKGEVKQKNLTGEIVVPSIESKKKIILTTNPVKVFEEKMATNDNRTDGSVTHGGEGEVHGVRARLYMKLESGEEVMREITVPESLSEEKFPWTK